MFTTQQWTVSDRIKASSSPDMTNLFLQVASNHVLHPDVNVELSNLLFHIKYNLDENKSLYFPIDGYGGGYRMSKYTKAYFRYWGAHQFADMKDIVFIVMNYANIHSLKRKQPRKDLLITILKTFSNVFRPCLLSRAEVQSVMARMDKASDYDEERDLLASVAYEVFCCE